MSKPIIICIDDESTILDTLKIQLKQAFNDEYIIETAEEGEEALELLEELLADNDEVAVVISDYLMPKIKGDELLKRIHEISPKTIKIMLTGQADVVAVGNAINYANLYRYITKPWQVEDLNLTVKEAVNSYFQDKKLAEQNAQLQHMNQALEQLNREQAALIGQLHENESRLRQFLEAMPVGVGVLDAEGKPYYINQKAKEIFGKGVVANASIEQLSQVYQIYKAGTNQEYPVENLPVVKALRGENAIADDLEIHQGSKIIPLEVWATPIYDAQGNIAYAINTLQDITERQQAQVALLKAEQKYRRIFENALEGIFQTTLDGRYLSVNPALAQIYGYNSPEELMATITNIQHQLYVDPHRRTEFVMLMQKYGAISKFESMVCRKDGTIIWISENARTVHDASGKPLYYQGFVEDITERKKADAERMQFTNELFQLNQAFSRFVPRQFLQLLGKKSLVDVHLGDQVQQEMSVLFSDIRDFTTLSERMTPQENFNFINAYLSRMESAIIENQGFIDKYMGDAVMALFGGSADDAVKAGITMVQRLADYNQRRVQSGYIPIAIGIGINTGSLMLGTVGGQSRMDSTVISDDVNLASRLEGLTKSYGVSLLISHQTLARLQNPMDYSIRFIEQTKVKGKSKAVAVFEVFDGDELEIKQGKLATKAIFEEGLFFYHQKAFRKAAQQFETVLGMNPRDRVAQIYLERCQRLEAPIPQENSGF
jgi:adenylate cyclase